MVWLLLIDILSSCFELLWTSDMMHEQNIIACEFLVLLFNNTGTLLKWWLHFFTSTNVMELVIFSQSLHII